jgi:hypothetical protein
LIYFKAKTHFKNQLLPHSQIPSISSFQVFAHAKDIFAYILYYNGYDDLMEKNLLENLFGIVVIIVFLMIFTWKCIKIIYIFYFLKFIFNINTLK